MTTKGDRDWEKVEKALHEAIKDTENVLPDAYKYLRPAWGIAHKKSGGCHHDYYDY